MDHGSRLILRVEEPSLFPGMLHCQANGTPGLYPGTDLLGARAQCPRQFFIACIDEQKLGTLFVPLGMLQEDMFVSFDPEKGVDLIL